jgi:type IV pilus assembly protein PilC
MAEFLYKVIKDGKLVKGEVEAKDKKEVAMILQKENFEIVSIHRKSFLNSPSSFNINIGGIPSKEKTIFLRQLAYMIQAGLPINQALETLSSQIKNVRFKHVISRIQKDVQEGSSLSQAIGKHDKVFDKVIINLVKAGEESGNLDQVLDRLAFDYEKKQEFVGKVKGAFIYPIVIIVIIIAVVALIMIVMIPSIRGLYKDFGKKELPWITTIMIKASDFLVSYWWATIIFIIILVISFQYYKKTPGGKLVVDSIVLKVPIFGKLIKLSQIAEFARTLSMLLKSGVPIINAVNLVGDSLSNQVFVNEVLAASKRLEKGVVLSQSISRDSPFTTMVFQMLSVGEQTGKTDSTLGKLADYYEKEVDQLTNNLTRLLEPIILVFMGLIILFIALAIYLPVYSLGS